MLFAPVLAISIPVLIGLSLVREVLVLSVNLWAIFRSMPVSQELGDVVPAAVHTPGA